MKKGSKKKNNLTVRIGLVLAIILVLLIGVRSIGAVFFKDDLKDLNDGQIYIGDNKLLNILLKDEINNIRVTKAAEIQAEKRAEIIAKRLENVENVVGGEPQPRKVVYLTFDDGPSAKATPQILDILDQYGIKATFFVVGNKVDVYPEIVKDTYNRGHYIANHSYSHDYSYIYRNSQNFLADFKKAGDAIERVVGEDYRPNIIRFPGGSFGDAKAPMKNAAVNAGYKYFDWNVVNGDAEGGYKTPQQLIDRVAETLGNRNVGVILMHDTDAKMNTVESLTNTIEYLIMRGYEFDTLDNYNY